MKAYLDITLLPSDDIGHHFLWSKVFQQIHLALVANKNDDNSSSYGVTFPEFNQQKHRLGRKIRAFAPNDNDLDLLNLPKWLNRLHDYVHITHVRGIPEKVDQYVRFTRLQKKSNKERLARRAAKRSGASYEQALQERSNFQPQWSNAPFIQMQSMGNGNPFRLLISMEAMTELTPSTSFFNTYGLSKGAVLPRF